MKLPYRSHAALGVLAAAAIACTDVPTPTQPLAPGAASQARASSLTHPQGVLSGKVLGFSGRPFGIDLSAKGLVLVTQQDANAVAGFSLDAPSQLIVPIPVTADPGDVLFNRRGTRAYVSTFFGGNVHIINPSSGAVTATIPLGSNAYRLALSKDESRLFVTSVYGNLFAVQLRKGYPSTSIALGSSLQGIAIAPSGQAVYVSSPAGSIWRVDPATLQVTGSAYIGGALQELVISPDGSELYAADEYGYVHVVNASTLAVITSIPTIYGPFGMALSPDGEQLYVAASATGTLTIIDRATRTIVDQLTLGGRPRRVAFDATGKTAVIANEGNWVDMVE